MTGFANITLEYQVSRLFRQLPLDTRRGTNNEEVLQETIAQVVQSGLDTDTQRLNTVVILSTHDCPAGRRGPQPSPQASECILVHYELVLEELCIESCEDQIASTTMYRDVRNNMGEVVKTGEFTQTLHKNAAACGSECNTLQTANAAKSQFGEEDIVAQAPPTQSPTGTVGGGPTGTRKPSPEPTPKPTKRGKGGKSKRTNPPSTEPTVKPTKRAKGQRSAC